MTAAKRRAPVTCEVGRHSAWLSGNNPAVYKAIDSSGVRSQYNRRRGCPAIPVQCLDDVLARLDLAGVQVLMAVAS